VIKTRLTTLDDVSGDARLPGYQPQAHGIGIVHLGVGAFHRAHQAVITDDALAKHGGDWRIAGVCLRSKDSAKNLNEQNGLYTLIERDQSATTARVIASIDHVIAADPKATLALLSDAAIRIVTLTVTEAGYGINRENRLPDKSNLVVARDLTDPENPTGVLGLLVASIARRREAGCVPFTVLSCDNLSGNGALLRDGVIGFARATFGAELAQWIKNNIAFPNSMVDRITPASTDDTRIVAAQQTGCDDLAAVEAEPFIQWVIEDNFNSGRPQWEHGGAIFVSDVSPYEQMKLTMLNGAHSMLAYSGFLTACKHVRDVMHDEALSILVNRHINAAASVLKPLPGVDLNEYGLALADRFANPAIAHDTYQIAADGTQKLPQRIFEPALAAIDAQLDTRPYAFATAMWMRFCLQHHDEGARYELHDPRAAEITIAISGAGQDASDLSHRFHALPDLIPARLADNQQWRTNIDKVLGTILNSGCRAAITREVDMIAVDMIEVDKINESNEIQTDLRIFV